MKKKVLLVILMVTTALTYSQVGLKLGATYGADKGLYTSTENVYSKEGKGNLGYHIALYKRFNLTGLYIQPELWYVDYKSNYKDDSETNINVQQQRVDMPVSVGTSILGIAYVQAGPLFSYYLKDKIDLNDISNAKQKDFTLGLQLGLGLSLQKFDISLRCDFALGERESQWIRKNNYNFKTESSSRLLHLSIGYNFL